MVMLDVWRDDRNRPRIMLKTIDSMLQEFDSFFDEFDKQQLPATYESAGYLTPACDVEENDKGYLLNFDLPGFKKDDLHIEISGNTLTISGLRSREEDLNKAKLHRKERHYGEFKRTFSLPDNIRSENMEANYENGVLSLLVPKKEVEKPKTIEISESKGGLLKKLVGMKSEGMKSDDDTKKVAK